MDLFTLEGGADTEPDKPVISTPIGQILLSASAGLGWTSEAPFASRVPAEDARLHAWESPLLRAEVLIVRPRLTLPPGLAVIDCRAAVWRVRARAPTSAMSFRCAWPSDVRLVDLGAENGERLDARSWSRGEIKVTLGTRDGDALLSDARMGRLPSRWASAEALGCEDRDCLDLVRHSAVGLEVPLPGMETGETCQVQFIVAWASTDDDSACWFAVDLDPDEIVLSLGSATRNLDDRP